MDEIMGIKSMNFHAKQEQDLINTFYHGIETIELMGPELLLGKLFDSIGFNKVDDELFRHLVITRLVYPVSKLKTTDYLYKYKGITIGVDAIYRYLDKLHKTDQIDKIKDIAFKHTKSILGDKLSVVFYDVTTLYFEAEQQDDLRKTGFNKDGKHSHPQILLGLLVSTGGYPITYNIFEGNKFEGHTLLPVIDSFKEKYNLEKLVVVADAGLLSNKNIDLLTKKHYEFILGARIKNETKTIKQKILKFNLKNGQSRSIKKPDGNKLIISYSEKRAGKDAYNRARGLQRLEKALKSGKLSKKHINNKGYNKYLKLDGQVSVKIDYDKFNDDKKWDGLKGYITNTKLPQKEVIAQYKQLWQIEKSFRISKTDLRIRPIYHYVKRRIEAHICIVFAATIVIKELERQLKKKRSELSPQKVIDTLKTIYALSIVTPYSKTRHNRLLVKTEQQAHLIKLFEI